MSVLLLVIVIIDSKRYPSTYCLMQGRSFVATFEIGKNNYCKIRITTFKIVFLSTLDIYGCRKYDNRGRDCRVT